MNKNILLSLALTFAPVFAQEAPPKPDNAPPPPHERREGPGRQMNRAPRINPEIMGILVLARDLVMEKYDTDRDGRFSPEEREIIKKDLELAKEQFIKKYDLNNDGKLSPDEWEALRKQWLDANPELENKIKELVKTVAPPRERQERNREREASPGKPGEDHQGKPEGRDGKAERPQPPRDGRNNQREERRPRQDQRGPQPQHNPLGMIGARNPHDPVVLATICLVIEKYDKDGDGVLSTEEFDTFMEDAKKALQEHHEAMKAEMEKRRAEMIKKYDKDGDGKLSREEREEMRKDFQSLRERNQKEE